jgi:hypothetical protein
MTLEVGPHGDHPEIQTTACSTTGSASVRSASSPANSNGQSFSVDVAIGDPILGEPELVVADDVLAFAGIALRRCGSPRIERRIVRDMRFEAAQAP